MRNAVFSAAAALLALAAGGVAQTAQAIPLFANQSLTIGGLQISVDANGCNIQENGGASHACTTADHLTLTVGSGSSPSVVIGRDDGSGHQVPIFNVPAGNGNVYDLTVDLTVQTVGGAAAINSDALTITGSASGQDGAFIAVGETIFGSSLNQIASANPTLADAQPTLLSFGPQTVIHISKDINDLAIAGSGPGNMVLTSVTQTFGQVPEPATVALMLTALTGLGVVRRRKRG